MMLYDYMCPKCLKIYELGIKLEDFDKVVRCLDKECKEPMEKIIVKAPAIKPFRVY